MTRSTRALTGAWVALATITLMSIAWAELSGSGTNLVTTVVLLAAAVKGRIILVWFMGLRSFAAQWRWFFDGWLLVVTAAIIGLHLVGNL